METPAGDARPGAVALFVVWPVEDMAKESRKKAKRKRKQRDHFFEIVSSAALAFLLLLKHFVLSFRHREAK